MGVIFLTILKIILCVLLGLVALLAIFLLFPSWVHIKYASKKVNGIEGLEVKVQILFVKLKIYPLPVLKKKTKKKEPAPASKKPAQTQAKEPDINAKLTFEQITELVTTATGAMKRVFSALHINNIEFVYVVQGQDAADTAIKYGKINAAFYTALAVLQNHMHIQVKGIDFIPDFANEAENKLYFACKIGASPIIILIAAWNVFKQIKAENII